MSLHRGLHKIAVVDCDPRFAILAPEIGAVPTSQFKTFRDGTRRARMLAKMQRLRGRVALREAAIAPSMLQDSGRYVMPGDDRSWHLLRLTEDGEVGGCARILVHDPGVTFPQLRLASSSIARCAEWGGRLRNAVEAEFTYARTKGLRIIEPGGWVVDHDLRSTCEAVSIALAAFALARMIGNCIGLLTATVKNGSSAILRRLGGRHLEIDGKAIPEYFEPAWGCNAELLRFYTNSLNPRFEGALAAVSSRLLDAPVLCEGTPSRPNRWGAVDPPPQTVRQPVFAAV